jgi:alpha-ketoglutarate-dependent taurine dioxygenase
LAQTASVNDDTGLLHITWNDNSFIKHELAIDPPTVSTFPPQFLRVYAHVVAECLIPPKTTTATSTEKEEEEDEFAFLAPYTGFPGARAPLSNDLTLWRANELQNQDDSSSSIFPSFNYNDILNPNSDTNLHAIQTMLRVGCVIIDGCSDEDAGESALHHLADTAFGGLQKDPTRDIANWKIVKKEGATSISYDSLKRLNQHTDSSIPPHGVPALCLLMHYAEGSGTNTFTDGYAVAQQLQIEDPEGYALLAQYGCDAERDFVASRVDSPQVFNRGLIVSTQYKVLQLDDVGNLVRLQYNEVFRTPLTLPHDIFPKWYAAFHRFVELIHNDKYEVKVPMKKGRFMLMNNWRILHGRAGGAASSNRILVGGTITRESIYSQSRRLLRVQKKRRHAAAAAASAAIDDGKSNGFTPDTAQEEEVMIRGQSREVEAANMLPI